MQLRPSVYDHNEPSIPAGKCPQDDHQVARDDHCMLAHEVDGVSELPPARLAVRRASS